MNEVGQWARGAVPTDWGIVASGVPRTSKVFANKPWTLIRAMRAEALHDSNPLAGPCTTS
jgi:hypothetical protein